ncbi:MAG: hypothetical protein Q8J99_19310 [Sulfuritalea sp.]|nr:hypothetical protein [Sulfuritalea sp.]
MAPETDGDAGERSLAAKDHADGMAWFRYNTSTLFEASLNFLPPVALYPLKRAVPLQETAMLMVMDMSTGKLIEDEFGAFEDEVLNAEWTPASPELQLGLQEVQHQAATARDVDADAFLAAMYRNQQ